MGYAAKILCDSVSPAGARLTTMEVTFPRFILAEFNTHRMLSRNSASSRAIPVEKRIAAVRADPFVPEVFGKNQRGMQAGDALSELESSYARRDWLAAAANAATSAAQLAECGVHKQLANRLLEPFLWHTAIVSATEWGNLFAQRDHPDAQPEFQIIARMMRELYEESKPEPVELGQWRLPLVFDEDRALVREVRSLRELAEAHGEDELLVRTSVGRCCRVSYLTHDGRRDITEDVALAQKIRFAHHMSPWEHPATPLPDGDAFCGNFRGWLQARKRIPNEHDFGLVLAGR